MRHTHSLPALLASLTLLTACGSGSSDPPRDDDPYLPTGLPAGTETGRPLDWQPVSSAIPEAERLSIGGFDSTSPSWDRLRRTTGQGGDQVCRALASAMIADRGVPESATADSVAPQTWYYWPQGYIVTFDWRGSVCEAEDWRVRPQFD